MASPLPSKGEAIPVDALFSPAETATAARRVAAAAAERRRDLARLEQFKEDNSALAALVRRLPDEVSHDVMVPFGGVAFFPGKLIHTNEFLVLLGEGYYAERSSKQTVEILQRRGKNIDSQMKSLSASVSDLEAEARYFSSTATEAAEGLVEIREEYIEEPQQSTTGSSSIKPQDNETERETEKREYDRVMEILAKLEREEQEARSDDDSGDRSDEVVPPVTSDDDDDGQGSEEEGEEKEDGAHRTSIDLTKQIKELQVSDSVSAPSSSGEANSLKKPLKSVSFKIPDEQSRSIKEPPSFTRDSQNEISRSKDNVEEIRTNRKPVIGSIIEHNDNLAPIEPPKDQASSSKPARPVSRFKLQKGGR